MKRFLSLAMCLLLLVSVASAVWAKDGASRTSDLRYAEAGQNVVLTSSSSSASLFKAGPDTFSLWGGPGTLNGKFQDVNGVIPNAQGWITNDPTDQAPQWQNSLFMSPTGTTAMWAGQSLAQQPGWTSAPGYGNGWNALLTYVETPVNTAVGQTVGLSFVFSHDAEPGFDFFVVEYDSANTVVTVMSRTGTSSALNFPVDVTVAHPIVYTGGDYGTNGKITIRLKATSDGGWSDEDGLYPSNGHSQVDNIVVDSSAAGTVLEDFQGALPGQKWQAVKSPYAGDFCRVYPRAGDLDPCRENITPGLGFMDTGTVPNNPSYAGTGTGGTTSLTWNYGVPGGWVVNYNGGISLGSLALYNEWWSPELTWNLPGTEDDGVDVAGAFIRASVYRHLPLFNGMFYFWQVRGRRTIDSVWESWGDRGFVYYSSVADWINIQPNVSDLLPVDKDKVQMLLSVRDEAATFAFPGTDATPAPYYDQVSFMKFKVGGPVFATREIDLFGDSFASSGGNDVSTPAARLALNWRVDMNRSVSPGGAAIPIRSGDSLMVDVTSVIPGVAITDSLNRITLHYSLNMNPTFEAASRPNAAVTSAGTGQFGWDQSEGTVQPTQSVTSSGVAVANRYAFDLPDDGFMKGGDVLEYYISAVDDDGRTTTFPANLAGYDDGAGGLPYNRQFEIRGLPTYTSTAGAHPEVLFWNDFSGRGGDEETLAALGQNGLIEGVHFDTYSTRGPSSLVDNGLGSASSNGRGHGATVAQIGGYSCILYESGDLSSGLISNGTDVGLNDKGNDVGLLQTWFDAVNTDRFIAHWGDNIAFYLGKSTGGGSGTATQLAYVSTVMGVSVLDGDVRNEINGQTAAHVLPLIGAFTSDYVAYGGCLAINIFDSIHPAVGAVAGHGFEVLSAPGTTYSINPGRAASVVWDRVVGTGRKVSVTFPYGMMYVYGAGKGQASAQAQLLGEVLSLFGGHAAGPAVDAPGARSFSLHASYPNPFNPKTTLSFTLGREGKGSVKIYNVRGELVRTLAEGNFAAGLNTLQWSGVDNAGASVASGVYVVKYNVDGFQNNQKIVLVK